MKRLVVGGLLLMASLSSPILASSVSCTSVDVQDADEQERDRDYSFNATMSCSVKASGVQADAIRKKMMDIIRNSGTVNGSEDKTVNDMNGQAFTFRDKGYNTGHGTITITFDSYLVANNTQVSYQGVMASKVADSYADNTQAVTINMDVEVGDEEITLNLKKFTTVTKPRIAPGFKSAVAKGLTKELGIFIQPYKNMLSSL